MPIYTLNCCTIEVAKGRQTATATRHVSGETARFVVIPEVDAPKPEVQAQWWAMGLPAWKVAPKPVALPDQPPEKPKAKK